MTTKENEEIMDNAYFAYITRNNLENNSMNKEMFNAGFYAGAQWAMRTSAKLSPHIAKFCELMVWLTGD